jgi:hypothetical protein
METILRMKSLSLSLALLFGLTVISGVTHAEVLLETGFEGSSSLPAGWTQSQLSGSTATWSIREGGNWSRPGTAKSGSNNATLYSLNTNDNKTRLISPTFDTISYTNVTLTFYHTQQLWGDPYFDQDELKVFFSSDGGTNWTELAHYTGDVATWTQRTLTLPVTSANSQIAFEGNAKYGYGVCLDDIQVTGIPTLWSEVSVSATDAEASEVGSEPGTWTVTRVGYSGAISVNYTLSGSATESDDYSVDVTSPINFGAGEMSKVVTLTPVDDTVASEGDEIATLTLTAGTDYVIVEAADDISIYDDEGFDLNILIVGSTHSFSEGGEHDVVHEKPFNPTAIATHLQSILAQDPALSDTVNVVFEDIFKTKTNLVQTSKTGSANITEHCYSLAQHYFWPEGKADRLSNLRGEDGTEWDYIILCSDPYIMANFPGMYAEGVKVVQAEVAQSSNATPPEVILMGQWPENSSTFTANDFNEIVHRVGSSSGLTVVPAGKVWESYTSQDTDAAHPTPKGEYLAAAAIYSKLYDRSAKTSGYSFPSDGNNIADHALAEVQAIAGASQYSGAYTIPNVFQMKYVNKRVVSFRETGTSTEDRLRDALNRLDNVQGITFNTSGYSDGGNTRWDFNYGRGNDWWEDEKDYEVDPGKYDRSYGFPMHYYNTSSAPLTMPYGIDKHYHGSSYEDGTDLGIAYNMVRPNTRETGLPEGHDVRAIPIRLIWLKMEQASPGFNPLGDNTHMNNHLNDASAAFMYTLMSGRCPIVEEPATQGSSEWLQWLGHKIGYETAWQMSHLTTRAPGFRVLPSSTSATSVTPGTTETMTVQFMNPPQSEVTVSVSVSSPTAAIVSPKTLTYTPSNHSTPQEVIVTGLPGASGSEAFDVIFTTTSNDEIYDNLVDSWPYTANRGSSTTVTQVDGGVIQTTTTQYNSVDINLSIAEADATNTVLAGPTHGSINWAGPGVIQYTPNGDYLGTDQIVYAVTIDGTQTIGTIDLTVQIAEGQINVTASDASASEEGPDTGTFTISRVGETTNPINVMFDLGGTATAVSDYNLSSTSPVTIPAGQSSVTLTLTPVDDSVFGEREESAVITILEDPAYPVGLASANITIADNDNRAPSPDAGPDQAAQIQPPTLVPGLYYGTVPGNIDETTPNPNSQILTDVSSETENAIAVNTTEIYTGNIYDADGQISFTEHIDDRARIWIDDVLVLSNDVWGTRSSTANLNLAPGWHSIEIRISNGSGGSGPVNGEIGIGYDPAGGTAWQTLVDPGDGSFLRVSQVLGVDVNLLGTVDDPDGDPMTTTWSRTSGPAPVTFGNAAALETTATFTAAGTYVLRLTADDGYGSVYDEVTIIVSEAGALPEVSVTATDPSASEEGPDTGTFTISRVGDTAGSLDVLFTMGGTATSGDDYSLSHSSPVTIPADQSSVTITLTPVDDSEFVEGNETVVLTISPDTAYAIATASDSVTIAENDNNAPGVEAGPNLNVTMDGSASWTPAQTSTALWLDADDENAFTINGDDFQWNDKSGNDRHATQTTADFHPADTANGLNSQHVLTFDGSDDYLDVDLDFTGDASHSAFIVVADITTYSNIYGAATGNQGRNSLHVGFNGTNNYRMNYWSHDYTPAVTSHFVATGSILNYVWDVGSPKQIYANGKLEGSGHNAEAPGLPSGGGRIGKVVTHPHLAGKIAEIIILSGSVSTDDRENIEGYLAHKWGLTTNLPEAHPYKSAAPGGGGTDVTLNGTVTDDDGQTPTTLWTNTGTGTGTGTVTFADASSVDTTATFTEAGTYVLRLTADDGFGPVYDEVTITINQTQDFNAWISGFDVGGMTDPAHDFDGDGDTNAEENFFGTLPHEYSHSLEAASVTTGGSTTFTFTHPMNSNPASDLTATYIWSKDLETFYTDGNEGEGTTVSFSRGQPDQNGIVTVTATIEGTPVDRIFVDVDVR